MDIFTIKEAETLTGIKAHTLRIWELRYEMKLCSQKNVRTRMYNTEEMKFLLRISYLIKTGYKISQIAKLNADEVAKMTVQFNRDVPRLDIYYNMIIESILSVDSEKFRTIVLKMQEDYPAETIIQEVLIPVSYHLEKMNQINKRNLIHIQLANQWISEYICYSTEFLPKQFHNNMSMYILFTPEHQNFETSLLFTNFMLRKSYAQTIYLGSNISIPILEQILVKFPDASLCFDLGFNDFSTKLRNYLDELVGITNGNKIFYTANEKMGYYANLPKSVYEYKTVEDILEKDEGSPIYIR